MTTARTRSIYTSKRTIFIIQIGHSCLATTSDFTLGYHVIARASIPFLLQHLGPGTCDVFSAKASEMTDRKAEIEQIQTTP